MIPVGAAIALGISNLFGSIFGGASSAAAQRDANETNLRIAQENRDFQENMSNTSFQRGIRDMRAAGLNPIMAASQGGASTPAGSTATVEPVDPTQGIASGISGGISSALSALEASARIDNMGVQNELQGAQIATERVKQQLTANSASEAAARTEKLRTELPTAKAKARFDQRQIELDSGFQEVDNIMNRVQKGVDLGGSALDMVNPLKGLIKGSKGSGGRSRDGKILDFLLQQQKHP